MCYGNVNDGNDVAVSYTYSNGDGVQITRTDGVIKFYQSNSDGTVLAHKFSQEYSANVKFFVNWNAEGIGTYIQGLSIAHEGDYPLEAWCYKSGTSPPCDDDDLSYDT